MNPRLLGAATVLLAAVLATGAVRAAASASEIEALVRDGKADEAIPKGRAAVGGRPDDVDLRLALARALAAKARRFSHTVNVKLSEADLAKGEIRVPGAQLGDAPLSVGYDAAHFEEALRHLDAGIDRAPRREDLRVFKCFLLTDADRIDRARLAIADALAALPKTPALAKTMASYGAERVKRGDPAGGAALLAPVAETFPSDAAVQADYGNTLTRVGRGAEAFAALDRAIAADPKDLRYQRTKATAAMLLRDFARARAAYDGLFRKTRAVEDEFAGLVAAYGLDPKGAAGLMTQAMAPSASSQPALVELADGFIRAGKSGAASGEAIALARRLMTAGQQVLAIPVLDRALAAQPGSQDARALMAQAYRELGCDALARPFARSP